VTGGASAGRGLRQHTHAGVRLLTLDRPERRNAFDTALYDAFRDALCEAQADDAVRAVVVTGAGRAFSAGQDLTEMTQAEAHGGGRGFPGFLDRLCEFDKPLVAAVNGVGVGLGLTLLLHCDLVYVAESARLRAPFVALGVVPEAASSWLLREVVGAQAAADILFRAEWIDARRAVEIGLAARRVADAELLGEALAAAEAIAQHPLGALRETKRLLLAARRDAVASARQREDSAFARRIGSPENLDAIRSFFARRAAG
jgi:enoyl-CoA hydratase/carnithine racemase